MRMRCASVALATVVALLPWSRMQSGPTPGRTSAVAAPMSPENTGQPVRAEDYRWQVAIAISYRGSEWGCGGVFISAQYILTAAHCVDAAAVNDWGRITILGPDNLKLWFGSDKFAQGAQLPLDPNWRPRIHPRWKLTRQKYAYDAAILKLATPFYGARPAPIRATWFDSGEVVTSGWGAYDRTNQVSDLLRAVKLPVITNAECRKVLSDDQRAAFGDFSMCARSLTDDTCARDSGGPLVAGPASQPQTIGLVSWGAPGDCGVPGPDHHLLGLYTRASELVGWARDTTGDPAVATTRSFLTTFRVQPRNDM